ncbi:MAG TPA: response regulator [Tepidisphaeraceae bacterium]|nr:response regulator [Tepidisphaeraceae bacterium]
MQRILVVDDDAPAGDLVAALLRHFGYDASTACGGDDALQRLGGTLPDLVLLDLMMPGMNGIEVLKRIRTDTRTAELPVVMLSALDDEDWRARAHGAGACDYWIKGGFDVGELEERVRSRLSA